MKTLWLGVIICLISLSARAKSTEQGYFSPEGSYVFRNSSKPIPEDRTKEGILNFFNQLISEGFILCGQQCGDGDNIESIYQKSVVRLKEMTGKSPALIGADYGWKDNNMATINRALVRHWNAGGLVTLSWHLDNPFTRGYNVRWNSIENSKKINLYKLLAHAPDSPEKKSYRAELSKVAEALSELKAQGVVVLWRPFHAMNGSWFWYGTDGAGEKQSNAAAFRALWMDLYKTLTETYHLDNLIWIYSPNKTNPELTASIEPTYPGFEFVDVVGLGTFGSQPVFDDYPAFQAMGKPLVISEVGPNTSSYGQFNQLQIPGAFLGKAAYFLQWHSWSGARVSIVDNLHSATMMNHPKVIVLEDLNPSL